MDETTDKNFPFTNVNDLELDYTTEETTLVPEQREDSHSLLRMVSLVLPPCLLYQSYCCFFGKGTQKDLVQAFQLSKKAAIKGTKEACFILGRFYEHGFGTEANMKYAFEWYLKVWYSPIKYVLTTARQHSYNTQKHNLKVCNRDLWDNIA